MQALLDKVWLSNGPTKLDSAHWAETAGSLVQVGSVLVDGSTGKFRGYEPKKWALLWEAPVPQGGMPQVLASNDRYVFFIVLPASEEKRWDARPSVVYVLEARTGKLVKQFSAVKANQAKRFTSPFITAVIAEQSELAFLSAQTAADANGQVMEGQYSVHLVDLNSWKTKWVKHFKNKSPRPDSRGFLMASSYPNYADEGLNGLSWVRDGLVVCGGNRDPIKCLKRDGSLRWEIVNPWEFRRGFMGPSVWSHFISRWGMGYDDQVTPAQAAATFNKQFEGAIVAGPAIASRADWLSPDPEFSIFVVVALVPKGIWSGYLARPILYEFGSRGQPLSTADLTRLPLGTRFKPLDNSLIWAGQNDSMFRLEASEGSFHPMGPGGPDMISRIGWYRQYESTVQDGKLTSGWKPSEVAYYKRYAFRPLAGGFVVKKGDKHIAFPIGVVDLDSGVQTRIDLQVPVTKPISSHTTNYSSIGDRFTAMGPLDIGQTGLAVAGQTLRCVLATPEWHGVVDFDAEKVLELAKVKR